MKPIDYAPKAASRKRWFRPRNLILVGLSLACLAGAAKIAQARLRVIRAEREARAVAWKSYPPMHAYYLDCFVRSDRFGSRRLARESDWLRFKMIEIDGKLYRVGSVQLISLNNGAEPFIYLSPSRDSMKNNLKESKHAPLDHFQADALKELQQGKAVVMTGSKDQPRLVGAVRVTGACLKCHGDLKDGTLLGALDYPLSRFDVKFDW